MAQRTDGVDLGHLDSSSQAVPAHRSGAVISQGSLGKDYAGSAHAGGGKSAAAVMGDLWRLSISTPTVPQQRGEDMSTVKVKSNSLRDCTEVLCGGQLIMKFDGEGHCSLPTHKLELLKQVQRARPGRYTVVTAVPQVPVAAPVAPAPAALVVEDPTPEEAPEESFESAEVETEGEPSPEPTSRVKVLTKKKKGAVVRKAATED